MFILLNIKVELKSTKYFPDNHTKMFQEGIKPMWDIIMWGIIIQIIAQKCFRRV